MCNCIEEKKEEWMKVNPNVEDVQFPTELFSGRIYLECNVKIKDKVKPKKQNLLLSHCPFCGKEYDKTNLLE